MEVHHHAHTSRKKWTHYLWEFIMLFLAVFCGFLAENQREHYVEKQRERKYIQNLLQDLVRDTLNYSKIIVQRAEREKQAYQLISLLYPNDRDHHLEDIYFFARQMPRLNTLFFPARAAMNQLKNSGAIRLIKKTNVTDSILAYDVATDAYAQRQNSEIDYRNSYREIAGDIFDASVFMSMIDTSAPDVSHVVVQPRFVKPLLTRNQQTINNFCTRVHFMYSSTVVIRNELLQLRGQAIRLIDLLKEEYHLK